MKIIVHAGMHKTGSTSLQHAYADLNSGAYHYLMGFEDNFTRALFLMFEDEDKLANNPQSGLGQTKLPELLARRRKITDKVHRQIERNTKPVLLLSAEYISGFNRRVVMRLAEFLRGHSDDINVYTYVRPPCSYMESAFNERLKHQFVAPDPKTLWPKYERRLRNVVDAFGAENNTFIRYDRSQLIQQNVVDDFAARTGLPRPDDRIDGLNISMTAEAIALIFAHRHQRQSQPSVGPLAEKVDHLFRKNLSRIGRGKLRFDRAFLDAGMSSHPGDLAWMEHHLGASLDEVRGSGPAFISGADDLLSLAQASLPDLMALNQDLGLSSRGSLQDNLSTLWQGCDAQQARMGVRDRLDKVSALGLRGTLNKIRRRLT